MESIKVRFTAARFNILIGVLLMPIVGAGCAPTTAMYEARTERTKAKMERTWRNDIEIWSEARIEDFHVGEAVKDDYGLTMYGENGNWLRVPLPESEYKGHRLDLDPTRELFNDYEHGTWWIEKKAKWGEHKNVWVVCEAVAGGESNPDCFGYMDRIDRGTVTYKYREFDKLEDHRRINYDYPEGQIPPIDYEYWISTWGRWRMHDLLLNRVEKPEIFTAYNATLDDTKYHLSPSDSLRPVPIPLNCSKKRSEKVACYAVTVGPKLCTQVINEENTALKNSYSKRVALSAACSAGLKATFAAQYTPEDFLWNVIDEGMETACGRIGQPSTAAKTMGLLGCFGTFVSWSNKLQQAQQCVREVEKRCG